MCVCVGTHLCVCVCVCSVMMMTVVVVVIRSGVENGGGGRVRWNNNLTQVVSIIVLLR